MSLTNILFQSPAIVSLYDATNGTLSLGWCPSVSITERVFAHENIAHDKKRYDQVLTLKIKTNETSFSVENALRTREATAQDITINALSDVNDYEVTPVFIIAKIKRGWGKTKGLHTIEIESTFNDPAKISEILL